MLVVIAIIGILAGMLSGPLMNAVKSGRMASCKNNLHQIGLAIFQYEENKHSAPRCKDANALSWDNATAELSSANLVQLFVSGDIDNMQLFSCPVAGNLGDLGEIQKGASISTSLKGGTANRTIGPDIVDGSDVTDYNLTAGYSMNPTSNRIIVADSPSATATTYSIHDDSTDWRHGANCLWGDWHVSSEKNKNPKGSTLNALDSSGGDIYKKSDKTGAASKATFIAPTGTGKSGS